MKFPYWPPHYDEILSTLDWLEPLAARELSLLEPLAKWLKDGNRGYCDIPPGIRNEIYFKDLAAGEAYAGTPWKEWGWSEADMTGTRWVEKAHPDDREFLSCNLATARISQGIRIGQTVFRIIDRNGDYHWNLASSAAIQWAPDGTISRYVGRDLDIGSRIEHELRLHREIQDMEERTVRESALLEAVGRIASVTDREGLEAAIEDAVPRILGMDTFRLIAESQGNCRVLLGPDIAENPVIGTRLTEIAGNGDMCAETRGIRCDSIHGEQDGYSVWDLGRISQGRAFAVLRSSRTCEEGSDRLMSALGPIILRAWDQLAGLEELRRHATTDPLTGVWNRRPFLEQAARRMRRGIEDCAGFSFVLLDIDHFKMVNDSFGHPRGDEVLARVSCGIGQALRADDLMCRWGGEEFAVFLDRITGENASQAVERIREAASTFGTEALGIEGFRITLSAGICMVFPGDPVSLDTAVDRADEALRRAKNSGRDRSEICESKPVGYTGREPGPDASA
jgi:diguanylate cyclase (GGDEF)-like protein